LSWSGWPGRFPDDFPARSLTSDPEVSSDVFPDVAVVGLGRPPTKYATIAIA
jgi:hypothetical protein